MNENDILSVLVLIAFVAMIIYYQVKSKQLANQSNVSNKE